MSSHKEGMDRSTYEQLKTARRPGVTLSLTFDRLLSSKSPSFRSLSGALDAREATEVRLAIAKMRRLEAAARMPHPGNR
jgi:hypothetical protein